MVTVEFSDQADRSLLDTLTYIAQDNPVAAMDLIEDLQQRLVAMLGQFPESGAKWDGGRRVFTIRRYAFVYRYNLARAQIVVLDVFGPGMNWR